MKKMATLMAFCALLSSCVKEGPSKKTFVYCSEGSPTAFNPQITTDGTSNNASAHTIYNRLVEFEYGSTKLVPALAESWDISEDKLAYTFKLRKGVKFHTTKYFTPTREMNADDVIFSFDRMRDESNPYYKVSGGTYEYFNGMDMGNLIKDIIKVDEHTVKITLTKPEAPFLANMAMSFMSILSKEYADQLIKENKLGNIDNIPVGTGPFVFKSYQKDNIIKFEAFKDFYGENAKVDRLAFAITPDASVRYQKLKTGECHLIIEPSPADLDSMKENKDITLLEGPGLNVGYLAMNTQKKPFGNLKVRQAINHALNKPAYIDAIYLSHAKVAKNPLPPTIWSYNDAVVDYDYNIEKAKQLLKEAGYPNGFETEIWTLPVTRPYNPNGKKMGEMMQADLAKIGIKVKLVSYEWPTYLKKSSAGEHAMVQLGWTGDNGDPDNFLYTLLGCSAVEAGSNYARWCNKDFESLVVKSKRITNIDERTELYKKAQVIFKEQAPWVPIAHSIIFRAMSNKVKGYKIDPLGGDIFKTVELK
ncbi:periplasmic dipeptide transport protein precursor [Halobacteriovorax marinus SJ]|uniref:Periplasmic dipeptide transport protein n=1 Tax=Halobacteriovorax marinus (strain ATCC BAA-682 / DSM 15412 / SJ) TaxID=862908 RepID=E1X4U4_HALMS|nr:ABC transporter substrate-binding protein [Halobacteriovorax marinus]CBW27170.1 periplasmic dipeptide transport protein precursor [Halobacteriovorax marinus SJ]